MRKWINLVENAALPRVLYHGTSDVSWAGIQEHDAMYQMEGMSDISGICFTADYDVAKWFAAEAVQRDASDDSQVGYVISFDTAKLAARFHLEDFHDDEMSHDWDEKEFRINSDTVRGIMSCIVGAEPVPDAQVRPNGGMVHITESADDFFARLNAKPTGNWIGAVANFRFGPAEVHLVRKSDDVVDLQSIIVPDEQRREGFGSKALKELCTAADECGVTLSLDVHDMSDIDDEHQFSNLELEEWYGRYGFRHDNDQDIYFRVPRHA